ncbi:glycosyltransferase family 2 protein [Thiomicrospira sp.]|uniref:glycosyltransferase family 2 protein n=1 Tax=Thiomicrospira sp. TaxID=935 RepID=UPI002F92AD99
MPQDLNDAAGLILHFRTPSKTLACINSLLKEGIQTIILVDNSEDKGRSLAAMHKQLEKLQEKGMILHVLSTGSNLGFAQGVNKGLSLARNLKMVSLLLINSDAYFEDGSLAKMQACLSGASVCLPKVKSSIDTAPVSLFGFYQRVTALNFKHKKAGCLKYPSGCCLLFRIADFDGDLLDEEFFFYGEDVELGNRLQALNVSVAECSDAVIVHEGSGSARNGSLFYEYHINRSSWLMAGKLAETTTQKVLYAAIRCITLPARAVFRCLKYRSFTPLKGFFLATLDIATNARRTLTPPAP